MYAAYKFIHLLGVVLLLGNITVTAVWKVFADRSGNPATTAFAQRLVTGTDWSLTLGGALLIMVGGYGMVIEGEIPLFEPRWLLYGQLLFYGSGLVWLCVLLPAHPDPPGQAGAAVRAVAGGARAVLASEPSLAVLGSGGHRTPSAGDGADDPEMTATAGGVSGGEAWPHSAGRPL